MSGTSDPSWQRSEARTVALPSAALTADTSLRWPLKSPESADDYSLDLTAYLTDSADSIESFSAVIAPYNGPASDLAITATAQAEGVITLWLSGGANLRDHAVTFTIVTAAGRTLTVTVWLLVQRVSTGKTTGRAGVTIGDQGERGADFLTGEGEPAATLGRPRDSYFDTLTAAIWRRSTAGWTDTGRRIAGIASAAPVVLTAGVTLTSAHNRAVLVATGSAPIAIVLDATLPVGFQAEAIQAGAGTFTLAPASTATLLPADVAASSSEPGDRVSLTHLGSGAWAVAWISGVAASARVRAIFQSMFDAALAQAEDARTRAEAAKALAEDSSTAIGEANNMAVEARTTAQAAGSKADAAASAVVDATAAAAAATDAANQAATDAATVAATAAQAALAEVNATITTLRAQIEQTSAQLSGANNLSAEAKAAAEDAISRAASALNEAERATSAAAQATADAAQAATAAAAVAVADVQASLDDLQQGVTQNSGAISAANNLSASAQAAAAAAAAAAAEAEQTAENARQAAATATQTASQAVATAQETAESVLAGVSADVATLKAQVAALLYVAPTITAISVSPSTTEVGSSVATVELTVARSRMDLPVQISGASTAVIPTGSTIITLIGPFTAASTWTATITDEASGDRASASATLAFRYSRYWGVSPNAVIDGAAVIALSGTKRELATGYAGKSITYDASAGGYPFYAYPAAWGTPSNVTVNGLSFTGFSVSDVTLTNASGATAAYRVLRFTNLQNSSAIKVAWN